MSAPDQFPPSGAGDWSSARAVTPTALSEEDYLRIEPKLKAKIRRFNIPPDEVEELVQQTFLVAHKQLLEGHFEQESALDTWVVAIGKNLCLKYHRARRAMKRSAPEVAIDAIGPHAVPETALSSQAPPPDCEAQDREQLGLALRLLAALPTILREPLVLTGRGYSYRQIARLLGTTPQLVSSRIHQARARLRRDLSGAQAPPTR